MLRITAAALALAAFATPAMAQDAPAGPVADAYIGPSIGYHNLGVEGIDSDDGFIGGAVLGFDLGVGQSAVLGLEGNFHLGTGAIDREYGVAARAGFRFGANGLAYVRGGYQWVNVDLGEVIGDDDINDDDLGVDQVDGDYIVGVGAEFGMNRAFGIGTGARVRVGIDTVSFDSIRPTAALLLTFGGAAE